MNSSDESNSDVDFTIITPSLNCAAYLAKNMESVRRQRGVARIEHWVIDGGSTDETLALLEEYSDVKWVSEPDRGLSHAVNKGLDRAKGRWIIWLNADDHLAEGAISKVLTYLEENPETQLLCGDLLVLDYEGTPLKTVKGWSYTQNELLGRRSGINQPSTWVRRDLIERVGGLDEDNYYTMDYEWMVRITSRSLCAYLPETLAVYRCRRGSITDVGLANQFRDFRRIRKLHGRPLLEPLGLMIVYYLATEPLRRIRWLRSGVRFIKRQGRSLNRLRG